MRRTADLSVGGGASVGTLVDLAYLTRVTDSGEDRPSSPRRGVKGLPIVLHFLMCCTGQYWTIFIILGYSVLHGFWGAQVWQGYGLLNYYQEFGYMVVQL